MEANRVQANGAQAAIDYPLTLEQRQKRILDQGGPAPAGLKAADFTQTAQDEFQKAGASMKTTLASGAVSLEGFKQAIKMALNGPDLLALPADARRKLAEINKTLSKAVPAAVKTAEKSGAGTNTTVGMDHAPKFEGDRLSKIGLFVGTGGPALDYARRTAEGIAKLVVQTAGLKSANPGFAPVMAWGA
jgi:hypothetical protein